MNKDAFMQTSLHEIRNTITKATRVAKERAMESASISNIDTSYSSSIPFDGLNNDPPITDLSVNLVLPSKCPFCDKAKKNYLMKAIAIITITILHQKQLQN